MNSVQLVGRIGSLKLNETNGGVSVATLRVATTNRVKRGESWEDATEWHAVVVWGKRAESLDRFLEKGDWIQVGGMLKTREYESKKKERIQVTEIHAQEAELITMRRKTEDEK